MDVALKHSLDLVSKVQTKPKINERQQQQQKLRSNTTQTGPSCMVFLVLAVFFSQAYTDFFRILVLFISLSFVHFNYSTEWFMCNTEDNAMVIR